MHFVDQIDLVGTVSFFDTFASESLALSQMPHPPGAAGRDAGCSTSPLQPAAILDPKPQGRQTPARKEQDPFDISRLVPAEDMMPAGRHLRAQEAYDRGMEHRRRGQKQSALDCFQETVRHHPQRWDALIECGRIHLDFKEFEGAATDFAAAVADLQKALDLKPEFPNPHKHLAWLRATCPLPEFRDGGSAGAHARPKKARVRPLDSTTTSVVRTAR